MKNILRLSTGQKGFTLIELLVVVAIISLLSSIVLASIGEARDRAKITAFHEEVRQFALAAGLYREDHGGELPDVNFSSADATFTQYFGKYFADYPSIPFAGANTSLEYVGPALITQYFGSGTTCGGSQYFVFINDPDPRHDQLLNLGWDDVGYHCYPL